jgi:hypothetical protein
MARKNPEQRLQIQVANFLRLALRPPTVWTAFPAGGGGKVRGARLKAMGLKAGWADLQILHPMGLNTLVVFIELKAKRGRLSEAQIATCEALWAANARYVECRSLEEVQRCLERAGVPLHGYVAGTRASEQERAA